MLLSFLVFLILIRILCLGVIYLLDIGRSHDIANYTQLLRISA